MTKILSCDLYDYLEIACMYAYQIEVELIDGTKYSGRAKTIRIADHKEYLIFHPEVTLVKELQVSVLDLKSMRVLNTEARFQFVEFN